jgi:2-polyprenyl-3-methyl-5-hydroxy-6-metoxy-1,4-benzoquinol methylase
MKKNEPFLATWHAYVGYKLDLFEAFAHPKEVEAFIAESGLEQRLLWNWVDVGEVVGHLKRVEGNKLQASSAMLRDFRRSSPYQIGELLAEMMDLHIPALLHYPAALQGEPKLHYKSDSHGSTVAATSALIEKRAIPFVKKLANRWGVTSALDVGCGQGGYTRALASRQMVGKGRYVGMDLNEMVVNMAQALANSEGLAQANFICRAFEAYEVGMPYDLVMLNNILHYYDPTTRGALLERAAQHLSMNGRLIIVTPLYLAPSGKRFAVAFNAFMQAHENLHALPREDELVALAAQAGLQLTAIKPIIREGSWYCLAFEKTDA